MPNSAKSMSRFLGCAGFFQPLMPRYSDLTCKLNEMKKPGFNWDPKTWEIDYEGIFNTFKQELLKATSLYYPDYALPWILRADASDTGIGWVLLQILTKNDGSELAQPIVFGSRKFSDTATRWHTYAKEGFAMFFAIKSCEYYLRGKAFVFEGDHANLQWIERSLDAKVIRWKIYMQAFDFMFRHLKGKLNTVADWQSRFYHLDFSEDPLCPLSDSVEESYSVLHTLLQQPDDTYLALNKFNVEPWSKDLSIPELPPESLPQVPAEEYQKWSPQMMFDYVHGHRNAHFGLRRTVELLDKNFPNHGITFRMITEMKERCKGCQKLEEHYALRYYAKPRHLKVDRPRRRIGIDYLSLIPDQHGNCGLYAIRDHFSKWLQLYPTASRDATAAILALFCYIVGYGCFDVMISDPGSELTSDAVKTLQSWFGIHQTVSLVDRHESNGVEGANKQILRHLRGLLLDERSSKDWSSPHIIKWVEFIINSFDFSESGVDAYTLVFGSAAREYFKYPEGPFDRKKAGEYLRILNSSLEQVKAAATRHQRALVEKRTDDTPQPTYSPGDLVLLRAADDKPRSNKLDPLYSGPYEVLKQEKNDVECRHLSLGSIKKLYVERLKLFRGSRDEARALASTDADQHVVECFLAYRGDPLTRTTMYFLVRFGDKEEIWLPWSYDLFNSVPYEEYCSSIPCLRPLVHTAKEANAWCSRLRRTDITSVGPDTTVFIDLRAFGAHWYQTLSLPDLHTSCFYVEAKYLRWLKPNRLLELHVPVFNITRPADHVFVTMYGAQLEPPSGTLVTPLMLSQHPDLRPVAIQGSRLSDFKHLVGQHFRDDEDKRIYVVTRVVVGHNDYIVAYVRPHTTRGRPSKEVPTPLHAADVAKLVLDYSRPEEEGGEGTVATR